MVIITPGLSKRDSCLQLRVSNDTERNKKYEAIQEYTVKFLTELT